MIVKLSSKYLLLADGRWQASEEAIERLILSHAVRSHLLALTPALIVKIRTCCTLGRLALNVLGFIEKRANDYGRALARAQRFIELDPDQQGFVVRGRTVLVGPDQITNGWYSVAPQAFVENGTNDGILYDNLIRRYIFLSENESDSLHFSARHCGGTSLQAEIRRAANPVLKGFCICDRDAAVVPPPFRPMARGVHDILVEDNIIAADQLGFSDTFPYFGWTVTGGAALENYVGPSALDVHLGSDNSLRDIRSAFSSAFPNFPRLDSQECAAWLTLDLKRALRTSDDFEAGFREMTGHGLPWAAGRIANMLALKLPPSTISWIARQLLEGRNRAGLIAAMDRDLGVPTYARAVGVVGDLARDLLAADRRMAFS